MKEYFETLINNIDISIYKSKLLNRKCNVCGGPFDGSICRYCGEKDLELEQAEKEFINKISEINSIVDKLQIDNIEINKKFNELLMLKNSALPEPIINEIENLINKTNYNNHYKKIKYKIAYSEKISKIEEQYLISLVTCSYTNSNAKINNISAEMFDLCNGSILCKQGIISVDLYKEVVIAHLTNALAQNRKNFDSFCHLEANFIFTESDEEFGHMINNTVSINTILLNEFVENGNIQFLKTLYHELEHIDQKKIMDNDMFTVDCLDWIKDRVIREYNPDYYKDNYVNISTEIDARIKEEELPIKYIEYLGFKVPEEYKKEVSEIIKEEEKLKDIRIRKIDGEEKNIDDIFYDVIKNHPELLKKYPQLCIEYQLVDNQVERLSFEEIFNKYNLIKETEIYQKNKEIYDQLFKKVLLNDKTILKKAKEPDLIFYHGGASSDFNIDKLDVTRLSEKQQNSSNSYAGFYMYDENNKVAAYDYAEQENNRKNRNDLGIVKISLNPNLKIYDYNEHHSDMFGITRLSQDTIKNLQEQGYDLIKGKVLSKTEYILLNKDKITNMEFIPIEIDYEDEKNKLR